jgi:hypothetical protein
MANTVSEPNTILEINEAHADNFLLVIPRLPSAAYLSSVFNGMAKSVGVVGSSGTSASPEDCTLPNKNQIQREHNLDLTNFKLYISSVVMPNVTIANYEVGTHFATLKRAGKIAFTDLSTTMQISENFLNYNVILYWMYMLHNPEEYNKLSGKEMIDSVFTDIYLIVTNNHREKIAEYKFMDAFPTSLPPMSFTVTTADKLNAEVTWSHSGMTPTNNYVLRWV